MIFHVPFLWKELPKKIVQSNLLCFLCACPLNKDKDRVFGKSAVDIPGLIRNAIDIDAAIFSSSDLFVCIACYKKLVQFEKITSNLRALRRELQENYEKGGARTKRLRKDSATQEAVTHVTGAFPSSSSTAAKSLKFPTTCTSFGQEAVTDSDFSFDTCPPAPALFLTSTPVAKVKWPSVAIVHVRSKSVDATQTSVKVVVQYPSKPVNQTLAKEYEAIGKALAYGPPHRLAKAVTKNKELNKLVVHNVMKLLSNEVSALCSRNNPSLLRKYGKKDLVNFDLQFRCEEWKERAPLFFSFLMTCCISSGSTSEAVKWLPSAAVAGSVLLKQRNPQMNATASVLGVLIKSGSTEV